jgi:hypothetical protein
MVLSMLEELRFISSNQVNIKMDDRENLERERERDGERAKQEQFNRLQ